MRNFWIVSLFALLVISCAQEAETPQSLGETVHFTATMPQSRTALGQPDGNVWPNLWSEGDAISVNGVTSIALTAEQAGSSSASFTVEGVSAPYEAVYPAGATEIPTEQSYVEGSYDPAAFLMRASSQEESLAFEAQVALFKFTPTGEGEARIASVSVNGYRMTSQAGVELGKPWFVAIAPDDYTQEGLTVIVTDTDGGVMLRPATPTKAYEAGRIYSTSLAYTPDPEGGIADAQALRAFLAAPSGDAWLLCDIDLQGESASAASFDGVFDGRGYTISNPGAPLFASNAGTLRNFTVAGSFAPDEDVFSPVVLNNSGTLENIVNQASVTVSRSAATSASVVLGGIAAYSSGKISSCSNEGSISYSNTASVRGVGIGGIAGYLTAEASDCSNSGALSFSASHPAGASKIGGISNALVSLGGIAAYGYTGFSVKGCTNSGEIHFLFSDVDAVTADSERHQIGGIAGSPCGEVRSCVNDGLLDIRAVTAGHTASSKCVILDVGGISGGEFFAPNQNVSSILSCTNNGEISVDFDATDGNTTVAGIVGWPGKEASAVTNRTEDCVNTGTLRIYGNGLGRFGGIQGGSGRILNCRNEGDIRIESTAPGSSAGGVCAFHALGHTLSGSSSTGNISTKVVLQAQGGLIGTMSNGKMTIGEGCSVNCTLESVATGNGTLGMVVGWYNGTSAKNTVGTSAKPVIVEGSVSLSGTIVPMTAANYTSWLTGTENASSNHTIYAVCNTPAEPVTQVEGHVRWSDGTPAAGVSVSNGFDVTVTDAQGHYTLPDNDDVWYFYLSMPSNAVIAKNADGCPDFYKRKLAGCTGYDFTLEPQAVENDFLLFALADPQAHNAKRNGQTLVNTDRFRDESVPALNARVAESSLPCYAVTLGDIVYSEDNQNSNGGLATMRSHCSQIDMPVFQTIGNHDYTWFYSTSGNELKTDATSSTLFLKAQRAFEACFGPINFSFNRGKVHVVCMRNVLWDSSTTPRSYHGGFTDEQYRWLVADLANVPADRTVIFCVHIPMSHCQNGDNVSKVMTLLKGFSHAEIFSGHTHYVHNVPSVGTSGIYEHIHGALCGVFWWSNIEVDGTPNGYSVYALSGGDIVDSYFSGVNTGMNTRDYQMRIYRGGVKFGGPNLYFQSPHSSDKLFINVFNSDADWKVKVYEDGVYAGDAQLMPANLEMPTASQYSTVTFSESSSQDWWSSGYHLGVLGKGFKNGMLQADYDYMDVCHHMYKYTMNHPDASIKVVAIDTYGNRYTCEEVVEEDCWYPAYMRLGNL